MAWIYWLNEYTKQDDMERTKKNKKSAPLANQKIQTPTPPQVEYPLEKPDSKKNQETKPGNSSTKK